MQHNTWTYTYDANGMRISRSNGSDTYKYVYNGDQLVQMTKPGHTLKFYYDAGGAPVMVLYNNAPYYYVTNLQGDTIMLLDAAGGMVVDYTVDAWGRVYAIDGSMGFQVWKCKTK